MKWSIDCILFLMTQYKAGLVVSRPEPPGPRCGGSKESLWPVRPKNWVKEAEECSTVPNCLGCGSNWRDNGVRSDYEQNHHFTDTDTGHWTQSTGLWISLAKIKLYAIISSLWNTYFGVILHSEQKMSWGETVGQTSCYWCYCWDHGIIIPSSLSLSSVWSIMISMMLPHNLSSLPLLYAFSSQTFLATLRTYDQ